MAALAVPAAFDPLPVGPRPKHEVVLLDDDLAALLGEAQGEFLAQAQRMPHLSRRLLLEGADPASVDPEALFKDLRLSDADQDAARRGLDSASAVLRRPNVLPPAACASLRAAVDAEHSQRCDTVDGAPDYQLNLSVERLDELIGGASAALWQLSSDFLGANASSAAELAGASEIFVRRYAAGSRPWNPFHTDSSALTINVALSGDGVAFGGGELLAAYDGKVRRIARGEGEATVHASTLLHGVSRTTWGVRHSLIVFLGRKEEAALPTLEHEAEAAALLTLLAADAFLGRCEAVCGPRVAETFRGRFEQLRHTYPTAIQLGRMVERVVQRYAAPHLQPTQILASSSTKDAVCWSLRALLGYAEQLEEVETGGSGPA